MAATRLSKAAKKRAARIRLDPKTVGAHSLCAGFVSTCVETNAHLIKSLSMLQQPAAQPVADHAAAGWV